MTIDTTARNISENLKQISVRGHASLAAAQAKMIERMSTGQFVSNFDMESLLTAQAEAKLAMWIDQVLARNEDDPRAALKAIVRLATRSVFNPDRSSSLVGRAVTEQEHAVLVNFIDYADVLAD